MDVCGLKSSKRRKHPDTAGVRPRPEAGFGLPEVLTAVVILTTALLGIAATAGRVGTIVNGAHRGARAQADVRAQLEEIIAQPYDSIANSSETTNGVQMTWTVTDGSQTKEVLLIYTYTVPGRVRTDTITAAVRNTS